MLIAGSVSIEPFEGSRWRLRRTRLAMGIESTFGLGKAGSGRRRECEAEVGSGRMVIDGDSGRCLEGMVAPVFPVADGPDTLRLRVPWHTIGSG